MSALITILEQTSREFYVSLTLKKLVIMFLGIFFGQSGENGLPKQVEELGCILHLHCFFSVLIHGEASSLFSSLRGFR